MPSLLKPSPPPRCACCRAPGPWTAVDPHLGGLVCPACRCRLRAAAAWLDGLGLAGCTPCPASRLRPKGGGP